MRTFILEWLTPQGVVAAGVLWGLVQQFVTSRRTAKAVRVLAETTDRAHAVAQATAEKIEDVAATMEQVKVQTNGMSDRMETLAGEAGEARGVARAEAAAEAKAKANS